MKKKKYEPPRCKDCGQVISFREFWGKDNTVKKLPVNPRPVYYEPCENGDVRILKGNGSIIRAVVFSKEDGFPQGEYLGFVPHFHTCSKRKTMRTKKTVAVIAEVTAMQYLAVTRGR